MNGENEMIDTFVFMKELPKSMTFIMLKELNVIILSTSLHWNALISL